MPDDAPSMVKTIYDAETGPIQMWSIDANSAVSRFPDRYSFTPWPDQPARMPDQMGQGVGVTRPITSPMAPAPSAETGPVETVSVTSEATGETQRPLAAVNVRGAPRQPGPDQPTDPAVPRGREGSTNPEALPDTTVDPVKARATPGRDDAVPFRDPATDPPPGSMDLPTPDDDGSATDPRRKAAEGDDNDGKGKSKSKSK